MAQYHIKTLFVIQGARDYYVEAKTADEAQKNFEKEIVKNNMARETIYGIEESVTHVNNNEDTRVDIEELKKAETEAWSMQMSTILAKSRKKLKDEMGFGVPDKVLKS